METSPLEIDEIRLLHLSRSTPSLLPIPGAVQQDSPDEVCFSLFDYFDWLVVRKGSNLDYKACFGLEYEENTPALVSSEYLTLVSLKEDEASDCTPCGVKVGDPFFDGENQDLSDFPFLSVMMVTALPEPGVPPKQYGLTIRPADVDHFLKICTNQLRNLVREVCQEVYPGQKELQAVFQVYNCMNSGNFCVVVRSRAPEFTYHVSMWVRAASLNQPEKDVSPRFPSLDCSTYTLVGLAYPSEPARTLPEQLTAQSTAEVALRLSVTNEVRNHLFQYAASQCGSNAVSEDLRGLYGRYDVTLRLSLRQFGLLYPWLCAHKLGRPLPEGNHSKNKAKPISSICSARV